MTPLRKQRWPLHAMFAGSAPATPNQVGAIRRVFERLGFGEADRPERLRITGQLARAGGQLASTKDLTMGQAGTVVPLLRKAGHRAELEAAAGLPASAPGAQRGPEPAAHGPAAVRAEDRAAGNRRKLAALIVRAYLAEVLREIAQG